MELSRTVVSFDIDGTMEFGEPSGPVPLAFVRAAIEAGHIVGSSSDRTRAAQTGMWAAHGLPVEFVGHKHHLHELRTRFAAQRWIHIGDTEVDERYAKAAGFEFWHVDAAAEFLARDWAV
jgi:hypothetical protein